MTSPIPQATLKTDYSFSPATPVRGADENRDPNQVQKTDEVAKTRKFASPLRYYPVRRNLTVAFTPGAKEHSRGQVKIYKIKHRGTGEGKVGVTRQDFRRRMQQHLYCARHAEADRGQGELYEAMRRSPNKYVMGVVPTTKYDDFEGDLETEVMLDHDTLENGFNKVKGGGGGTIADDEPVNPDDLPKTSFQTPEKGYRIKSRQFKRRARLFVDSSPSGAKKTHVVYGFRRDDGKWLIGETCQQFRQRMYGYHYAFNHPERDVGKRPLPLAVRLEPWRWRVYILYQGPHIKQMERLWIKAKNAIEEGFNQVGGGGGPVSKR